MAITTAESSVTQLGNGVTTTWDYEFPAVSAADLVVTLTDTDGTQTVLESTEYTVVQNSVPVGGIWAYGGTVTYPLSGSPITAGQSLTIERVLPLLQEVEIGNQGNFYPQVVEEGLDLLEMQIQQLASQVTRSIQVPAVDIDPTVILPAAAARAGKYLYFDASGNATVSEGTSGGTVDPLAPYFTPTGADLPPSGNGMYAPSTDVIGIASNDGLCVSFANPGTPVNYFQFAGSATATPAYNTMSVLGTDAKIGIIFASKGTSTSGSQFYGNQTTGRQFFTINGAKALEITDDWWNPNVSYQGATTAWPVLSSGALAGGPDNIAVVGCNSSIYPGTATGVTLMYCARGSTGAHHFTNNGVVAHVNIGSISNPNGVDTYNTAASALWLYGAATGSGDQAVISTQGSTSNGTLFYDAGTGGYEFKSDNTATRIFKLYRVASAVNALFVRGAAAAGIPYLGAEGDDTNTPLGITSKGTGNVRIYTNTLAALQAVFTHTASAINAVSFTGGATGNPATITVGGVAPDTNVGLNIKTRGTTDQDIAFYTAGVLQVRINGDSSTTTSIAMNGSVDAAYINAQGGTNPYLVFTTAGSGGFDFSTQAGGKSIMDVNDNGNVTLALGNLIIGTATKGLVLKRGANGKCGTFVLTGTTPVSVNNTSVAITDSINPSLNTVGGTVGALPTVKTITAGVGFTIAGTAGDTSTYNYNIISNAA